MNLLLISKTQMIIKIFELVCAKMNVVLTLQDHNEVDTKYDLILIDEEFIDDRFNIIKQFSQKLGAITSEELPFEKARDFIIPRPFLPQSLQTLLEEQIELIKEEKAIDKKEQYDDTTVHVTDYVESLADDIALDIDDESDESIVTLASLKDGGVLDMSELGKINDILHESDIQDQIQHPLEMDEEDWKDLSEIIDDALDEVQDYEFDVTEDGPINIILSQYNIEELKPLLQKFDQNVIDKLSNGKSVDLRLSLKAVN